jgi:hypothetical protein
MLKVTWRNNKLDYDILNFNNVEIFYSEDDHFDIVAIKHYFGLELPFETKKEAFMRIDPNAEGLAVYGVQTYSKAKIWVKRDIERTGIIEDGTKDMLEGGKVYTVQCYGGQELVIEEEVEDIPYIDKNGMPVLPFVLFFKNYPVDSLLDFSSGNDLYDLNINVAILLIWLNTLEKYQSFKQVVINTDRPDDIPGNVKMGPADVIVNPTRDGGGSVDVLDMQTNIETKYKVIKDRIYTVLATYGMSPENFSLSASPQSGFAAKINQQGKLEVRQAQLPIYRLKEKELFEIEKVVWNYHNPLLPIDVNTELSIDFAEVEFPQTTDEYIKEMEFKKRNNIITDIDMLMEYNPDLTDDEAKTKYSENKTINQSNQQINIGLRPINQPGQNNNMGGENANEKR